MCKKHYYKIKNKYLADSLSYLGFRYYKFTEEDGMISYGFHDTKKFRDALKKINDLKKELYN